MERAKRVLERLKGPVVPINLCFNEDESINYEAVAGYVDWLCRQNVPVLLMTYGSSEFASLTEAEIWRLTEEIARANDSRSLFIAATGFWPPAKCREFLRYADAAGVDAVKIQMNTHLGFEHQVIVNYFDAIQDASSIPLLLLAVPGFSVDTVIELAKRPQIIGMKNDSDPFYYYYDVLRATAGNDFAVISGGQMRSFAFGYQNGSPAYLCTIAPIHPGIALKFYNLMVSHRYDDAWQIVYKYEDPWLKTASEYGWLRSIKTALNLYGLYPNNRLRLPAVSHNEKERAEIRKCLEQVFGPVTG